MTGKEYVKKKENIYCLVCKKKTDNKKIRRVALVNKITTQCTVCTSRKSTFLKPIKPITNKTNKKQKQSPQIEKTSKVIVQDGKAY